MSYFLFEGHLALGFKGQLSGKEAQHLLHSRRAKQGELIELQDQQGHHFQVVLESFSRDTVFFRVQKALPAIPSSPLNLEMLLGLTKEKALSGVIQKGTELGVAKILIFEAHFSPRTIAPHQQEKTLQRWQTIAQESCKQSHRNHPPEIQIFSSLQTALFSLSPCSSQWVFTPESSPQALSVTRLLEIPHIPHQTQRILIGPEGGLHPEELTQADQFGMQRVHLGKRILRSDTAALAVSAIFQFVWGDLGREEDSKTKL